MKRFTKYTALALGFTLALGLTSCKKDFLERTNTSGLSGKDAESTREGMLGLVNGLHNMMYQYNFGHQFGAGAPSLNVRLDFLGDDVINTRPSFALNEYRYAGTQDEQGGEGLNYKAWDYYYTLIQHANAFIRSYRTQLSSADQQDEEMRYAKGEAHAIRAYAYHQLVQLFSKRYDPATASTDLGVILRTDQQDGDDRYAPMARSSVADTYALIDSDLKESLDLLKGLPQKEVRNHLRYSTVCGIAARVALAKADWATAETRAKEAISGATSQLQQGEELLDGFNNYEAKEWMWGYRQSETQNNYFVDFNANYAYNFLPTSYSRGFRYAVNRELYDQLGDKDVRRKWWYCYDLDQTIPANASPTYFGFTSGIPTFEITGQCIKYAVKDQRSTRGDKVVMRLGEMYYIQAEAQARQGKNAEAQQALFEVVKTRDADFTQPTETGDKLIEKIFLHKRMDLIFEGVRFFDMKRLRLTLNRTGMKNIEIIRNFKGLAGGETYANQAILRNQGPSATFVPKSADDKLWQFKIPEQELRGNPLCKQND